MEDEKQRKGHIVVFSTLEQGHLIPSFHLTLGLAARGVAVTFVTTPLNVTALNSKLALAQARAEAPLRLRFHPLSLSLPPGYSESCHALHPSQFMTLYHATEQLQPSFRDLLITLCNNPTAQWPAPACVIGDMFTGWLQQTANSLGIPGFTFFTSPAYGTLVYNSLWYHLPHNNGGLQEDGTVRLPDLPAWLPLARSDLSRRQLEATRSDPWRLFVCRQVEKNALSEGFIINAFSELEPQVIEYLSKSSGKPVWTVGPVVPFDFVGDNEKDKSCLEWLNKQTAGSVVYVSFGSRNFLSPAQVKEVAAGLQESGKPFLWVLRTPPGDESSESLAEGEIAGGRGLVIRGWAPQMQILSHSSTGAFVSHCGWNSMSESIINGVPLICWPMAGEQFLNAKWVVEELGVAVRVPRREDGFVSREQLQRVMRFVMEEEGRELRVKVSQLAQRARAAIADGGSSAKNWDSLVNHISSLQSH